MKKWWIPLLGLLCIEQSFAKETAIVPPQPVSSEPGSRVITNIEEVSMDYASSCILKDAEHFFAHSPIAVEQGSTWWVVFEWREESKKKVRTDTLFPARCITTVQTAYKNALAAVLDVRQAQVVFFSETGQKLFSNVTRISVDLVAGCPSKHGERFMRLSPLSVEVAPQGVYVSEGRGEKLERRRTENFIPLSCIASVQLDYKNSSPKPSSAPPSK